MELALSNEDSREEAFAKVDDYLSKMELRYVSKDLERPWGGFFVIDEGLTRNFIDLYFPNYPTEQVSRYGSRLSPKILVVEPGKKLSWQYHNRRAELWRVVQGPTGVITSGDDDQGPIKELKDGETIQFDATIRHRLVGLENWGVIAEIWQHTDAENPSNEEDIIRLKDDFNRIG